MYRNKKLFLALTLAGLLLAVAWVTALALGNLLNVSNSSTDAGYPAIAVSPDGQNIGIVWAEGYGPDAVQGSIYLKSSTDGASLSKLIPVDEPETTYPVDDQSWQPDIAVDPRSPSVMHVAWKNRKNAHDDYLYYARCPLTSTCQTAEQVVKVPASDDTFDDPGIAVTKYGSNQTIKHLVWRFIDNSEGSRQIKYSQKIGNGSWVTEVVPIFSSSSVTVTHPAIATSTDGGQTYLHVVWATNNNIQYCRGTVSAVNGSVSWNTVIPLSMPSGGSSPDFPAVVAMTDTVVVLWDAYAGLVNNFSQYYLVYMASTNNGFSFTDGPRDIPTASSLTFTPQQSDDGTTGVESSLHAKRLQLQATMVPTSTAGITGVVHVVWHESFYNSVTELYRHDVHYGHLAFDASMFGESLGVNEIGIQDGDPWCPDPSLSSCRFSAKKGTNPDAYSMSPDIAVDNTGQQFLVYMEGTNSEYRISDDIFNIIYNGAVELVDNTLNIYLPIITKKAS